MDDRNNKNQKFSAMVWIRDLAETAWTNIKIKTIRKTFIEKNIKLAKNKPIEFNSGVKENP